MPAPRNTRDPHDYYRELGVDPGATTAEIKARLRQLYVELHPDTGERPDPEKLTRVRNIAEVLLDDEQRLKYNNTPEGHRLMDKVYAEELSKLDVMRTIKHDKHVREALQAQKASPYGKVGRFDYFSIGQRSSDALCAQQWYHYLLGVASRTSYTGRLRLMLWDGERPAWNAERELLMVPRRWEPSAHAAKALVTRVIGSTGVSNISQESPELPTQLTRA
ncbi:DnaJ-like chaperonin [Mycobacterium phage ScoobyDoobyDoo]|nr:DnaJ-like chaperonin [Mycobacterium phage ScoobyDoobyDoo]